ncbi:TPA: hypothetical protein ACX96Z_000122 [Clostridium sporogenes]
MIKNKIIYMSDTVHGTIQISEIENKIISTSNFNRLHNISQNSTAYLTFPTNRTKRFEHSIGTMHLAGRMFYHSIANADKSVLDYFFSELRDIINKEIDNILINNREVYKYVLQDKNFKSDILKGYDKFKLENSIENIWLPSNVEENDKFIYFVIMQSIRLSALLHDVGHPPFSHIAESALKTVWKEIANKDEEERNTSESEYYRILEKYFINNGELHEQIGNTITSRLLGNLLRTVPKSKEKVDFPSQMFLSMIKEITNAILNEKNIMFRNIHKLIDGSLDCDRLDYVTRDVLNSGFNNGIIEYDRLINSMKLIRNQNNEFIFCIHIKVLNNIENFFERRWNLYKQIIFHHRVIKTDYLLNNCIYELISMYLKNNSKSEMKDNILPYNISGLWLAVQGDSSDDVFFNQLIQWDDSWLMVVLKKEFLSIADDNNELELLKGKLNELLTNQKYYYSVIKKPDDCIEIEKEVVKNLVDGMIELEKQIIQVKNSRMTDDEELKQQLIIDPFINDLEIMISSIKNYEKHNFYSHGGFILSKIKDLIFSNYLSEEDLKSIVKDSVQQAISVDSNIKNAITEFKSIKIGVQEGLFLYYPDGNIKSFRNVSNITKLLLFRKAFLPPFYVYISTKDADVDVNYSDFKARIGYNIAKEILDKLNKLLWEYKCMIMPIIYKKGITNSTNINFVITNTILSMQDNFTCEKIIRDLEKYSINNERLVKESFDRLKENDYLEEDGSYYRVLNNEESKRWCIY